MAATAHLKMPDLAAEPIPRPSVAEEMNAIFAALPYVQPGNETPILAPARKRGRRRVGRWLVALVIATLAIAAGLILLALSWPRSMPPRAPAAVSPAPRTSVIRPPGHSPPTPALPVSVSAPAVAPEPSPPVRSIAVKTEAPPALSRQTARPQAPLSAKRGTRHRQMRRCPHGASAAWCLRGAVTAADDQLRDAYDEAVEAGVARPVLVGVRNDWARLRGRANRDPEALIRGYALLTQALRAEVRQR